MKKLIVILSIFFFFPVVTHADLWDRQVDKTFAESYSYGRQDYDGYTYRGGVGYQLPYRTTVPRLGYMYDTGLGCEGFDLNASFLNNLNAEALKNYASEMTGGALAAAPMLLLEYLSPTTADVLKHFKSMSQDLLRLQYMQCEDFQGLGEDWIAKKRGKAAATQMKEAQKEGLSLPEAIEKVKEAPPLEGLKDYNGNLLGSMKLVEDGFKWAGVEEEMTKLAPVLVGEVIITAPDKIEYVPATKSKSELYKESQKKYAEDLQTALENYDSTGEISESNLKKLSISSFIITPAVIKAVGNLPGYKRSIAGGKLASALALDKTVYQMDSITSTLEQIARHPELTDEDTNILLQKANTLRKQKHDLIATHQMQDTMVATVAGGIVTEAATERAEAVDKNFLEGEREKGIMEFLKTPYEFGYGGL